MKPRRCLWWLRSTRSHTTHTYRLFSCSCTCSEILQLMVLLRPTRPHAAQLIFHCLDLSKDPNLSSCMHPETHLAIRDCRHLCRSPPYSPCFLHIKNLLVDVLDLFFIPVHPKDSQKTRPIAPWSSTIRVQVSGRFPCLDVFKVETGNLKSTIQQLLSFPCSRQHCTSQTPRSHSAFGDR